jgi:hypothetical protein
LPKKAQWQAIANDLPRGDVLIVLPHHANPQRVARSIASLFRTKGKRVTMLGNELRANGPE